MAQRRIGQEAFRFGAEEKRRTSLDELGAFFDWRQADLVLAPLYPSVKGEKAWPPLAMFKALLRAAWYDLSGVAHFEALPDRASFRRFYGFARDEETPERTAFVRLRGQLAGPALDRSLFAAIARDLESKGASERKGTSPQSLTAIASLIDATITGSAAKGDPPAHGYEARLAAGKDSGTIRDVATAPANEPDVSIAPLIIPDTPGEDYAGKA